ncbi:MULTISPECIES: TetR/AcrR family transcriptional regulator [unclassified Streptomyces]|uniref:TetR/AcrR family transcriptional regulator n=1 Tax=unclassified Streptomyces TaxID=2593676 RepID=UPI0022554CE1|nr:MULTISPECIES: TetR/AcrR family transcriptional regulator [unclassified Streptomyces]MCX4978175.1 TetR/AcrR family transcriptional regulator [Streptomyces sp. NBC_00620]WTB36752.1 TetR/AcrR family transcriptional regulator [Streptomyces sp. NBC_00827]
MVKQERASRTHERFLDASAHEFSRHGYAGANLQRIAAHVGMTKGALYAHFPSKDALAAVFTAAFDRVGHELLQEIGEGDPPLTSLRHVTIGFVRRMQSDLRFRAGLRLASEEACTQGRVPALIVDISAALTRLVGDAQEKEQLTNRQHPELISSLVVALMFGMYYTAPATGIGDNAEQVRQVWQLLSVNDTE